MVESYKNFACFRHSLSYPMVTTYFVCLADIIKKYNPNVKGFSLGKGDVNSENAHLNVANPGDQARSAGGLFGRELFIVLTQYELQYSCRDL